VILDPDEQVQAAVRLVFDLYDESGSAGAVVKHFADHHLLFPTRLWGGVRDGELVRIEMFCESLRFPASAQNDFMLKVR
jgi:hypothetical protein